MSGATSRRGSDAGTARLRTWGTRGGAGSPGRRVEDGVTEGPGTSAGPTEAPLPPPPGRTPGPSPTTHGAPTPVNKQYITQWGVLDSRFLSSGRDVRRVN